MEPVSKKLAPEVGKGKKLSKAKIVFLSILGIIVIGIVGMFIRYLTLEEYSQADGGGDITTSSGIVYQFDTEQTGKYASGELKSEGIIGRIKGKDFFTTIFFGPEIIKLKDYDVKDKFALNGLMRQEVYTREK